MYFTDRITYIYFEFRLYKRENIVKISHQVFNKMKIKRQKSFANIFISEL